MDEHRLNDALAELREADRAAQPSQRTVDHVMRVWDQRWPEPYAPEKPSAEGVEPLRRMSRGWWAAAAALILACGTTGIWWMAFKGGPAAPPLTSSPVTSRTDETRPPRDTGSNAEPVAAAGRLGPDGPVSSKPVDDAARRPSPAATPSAAGLSGPPLVVTPTRSVPSGAKPARAAPRAVTPTEAAPTRAATSTTDDSPFIELVPTTPHDLGSGRVVRMRLPEMTVRQLLFAPPAPPAGGFVQADVLVGEDGLARAIRVVR